MWIETFTCQIIYTLNWTSHNFTFEWTEIGYLEKVCREKNEGTTKMSSFVLGLAAYLEKLDRKLIIEKSKVENFKAISPHLNKA